MTSSKTAKRTRRRRRRINRRSTLQAAADKCPKLLRIEATGTVELQAADAAESEGGKRLRTFSGIAYSGGRMRPRGFSREVVLDLAGTKVASGNRPILLDHDPRAVVGHSTRIAVAGNIELAGVVSGAGEAAREVVASADNEFPWRMSVGAAIEKINFIPEGESAQANGQTWQGPMFIVRAATINEVSFVTLAGDENTAATIAAAREAELEAADDSTKGEQGENTGSAVRSQIKRLRDAGMTLEEIGRRTNRSTSTLQQIQRGEIANPPQSLLRTLQRITTPKKSESAMTFEQWLEANGHNDLNEDQQEELRAAYEAEHAPATPPARPPEDPTAHLRASAAAEIRRQEQIATICARYDSPQITVDDSQVSLRAHAVENNWTAERVELEALRASRPSSTPRNSGGNTDRTPQALCAALCLSAGLPEQVVSRDISEDDMNRAMEASYRHVTLHMVLDQVIQAAGHHYSGSRKSNDFIRAALRAERELTAGSDGFTSLQASSGFSTISLSGILGNTANKALIAAYEAVETVHQIICAQRNHSDFKVWTRYRLDSEGAFKKVGPDGELKHVSLSEDSYTNQLDTYGAMIALTRQMIVNDDLDAFMQIPTLIGRMSAIKREEEVFKLLLSNPSSFFHANNNNLITDVLAIAGLTTAEQTLRDQVDSNGKPVLVSGKYLLTGTALAVTAKELHDETKVQNNTGRDFNSNPHVGKYEPLGSPYLNNTAITDSDGNAISGQSGTLWYLFADPRVRAAIAIASLNGERFPTIESAETDFSTLGMQWRGYDDFGVGMEDPVAAVNSSGAG